MGEGVTKQFHGCNTRPPAQGALAARAESHAIAKLKPKIRIVHIVAPEIIQTDAANFRDLVQRLTGKPACRRGGGRKKPTGSALVGDVKPAAPSFSDLQQGYRDAPAPGFGDRVKVEVEADDLWMADTPGALFGSLATDLDGFMQGLGELPLIPLSSSHVDLFGEETSGSE